MQRREEPHEHHAQRGIGLAVARGGGAEGAGGASGLEPRLTRPDRHDDSPSMKQNALGPLLSRAWIEWFLGHYLTGPDDGVVEEVPGRYQRLIRLWQRARNPP